MSSSSSASSENPTPAESSPCNKTTTTTPNSPILSQEEESCLKSALAFVVLRRRRRALQTNDDNENKSKPTKKRTILNGLLSATKPPNYPLHSSNDEHIHSMLRVALSTALSSYVNLIPTPTLYDYNVTSPSSILDGLASHIATHFRSIISTSTTPKIKYNPRVVAILQQFLSSKSSIPMILATCTVFQRLIYFDCTFASEAILVLCREISQLYHGSSLPATDEHDDAMLPHIQTVNYLYLLEIISALRLSSSSNPSMEASLIIQQFQQELGEIAIVPVEMRDLALFYYSQKRVSNRKQQGGGDLDLGGKIMLRLFLFDIVQKLSWKVASTEEEEEEEEKKKKNGDDRGVVI